MKIESTGLPTILDEKKSSRFIELSLRTTGSRLLVSAAHISMVGDGSRFGCEVYYGNCDSYVEVRESYDEVKRLMEEAD